MRSQLWWQFYLKLKSITLAVLAKLKTFLEVFQ